MIFKESEILTRIATLDPGLNIPMCLKFTKLVKHAYEQLTPMRETGLESSMKVSTLYFS